VAAKAARGHDRKEINSADDLAHKSTLDKFKGAFLLE
jgi:hypothetical protein